MELDAIIDRIMKLVYKDAITNGADIAFHFDHKEEIMYAWIKTDDFTEYHAVTHYKDFFQALHKSHPTDSLFVADEFWGDMADYRTTDKAMPRCFIDFISK